MTDKSHWTASHCAIALLTLPLCALAQEIRLGSEFQVNSYTFSYQLLPVVTADADGDFVVAWNSYYQDGDGFGVFAQRFSSAGAPLSSEFQVNSYTTHWQTLPALAADADGDFVVAWNSDTQDGDFYGVFARRFSSAGAALASEFQVNTYTTGYQVAPAVAADADGDFVVAWRSQAQDRSNSGIFARRFSSTGVPLAGEFQVNTYTTGYQVAPAMAVDADGDLVVVWLSDTQDGSSYGVFARRFSSAGVSLASEFQVNSYTTGEQSYAKVAADADGDFVVVWMSYAQDGSYNGVFAQRYSSEGVPLANEFQVNPYTTNFQSAPALAVDADGDFVVTWTSAWQDGSVGGVFARRFSRAGVAQASDFQINSNTSDSQSAPAVATAADGDFVVAWQSFTQDGSNWGVFGQRFASGFPTATATVTATSTVTPTATPSPTTAPTQTPSGLYEVPTLSGRAMAILALLLLTLGLGCLLLRRTV